jgi:L-rhamnose mutarotase
MSSAENPTSPPVAARRFVWVAEVRPEKLTRYRALHTAPWPAVNAVIQACNIRNYSIHLGLIEGKPHLFSYLEYIGSDFAADMARMAADTDTQRWWAECVPCLVPRPGLPAPGVWAGTEEIYHLA